MSYDRKQRILIVEPDRATRFALWRVLRALDADVRVATSAHAVSNLYDSGIELDLVVINPDTASDILPLIIDRQGLHGTVLASSADAAYAELLEETRWRIESQDALAEEAGSLVTLARSMGMPVSYATL